MINVQLSPQAAIDQTRRTVLADVTGHDNTSMNRSKHATVHREIQQKSLQYQREKNAIEKQNPATLMELAVNNGNNQKDKNRNDSNRNYPIRSHPAKYH